MSSINIYSSPLCSCIVCRESKSSKSIHTHFVRKHTNLSVRDPGKGSGKFHLRCSCIHCKQTMSVQNLGRHMVCCTRPTATCLLCGSPSNSSFCSHSCSAKFHNQKRYPNTKKQKIIKDKLDSAPYTKISQCVVCNRWHIGYTKTCSKECLKSRFSSIGKQNATKRMKRSKDEIALFELCADHFLNVTHNDPIFNGWDADILIHDTKTAILWNGPWHYQEMNFGTHSMKQVQNRDRIKIQEITKSGWSYLIFEDRHFSPETAFEDIKLRTMDSNHELKVMSLE